MLLPIIAPMTLAIACLAERLQNDNGSGIDDDRYGVLYNPALSAGTALSTELMKHGLTSRITTEGRSRNILSSGNAVPAFATGKDGSDYAIFVRGHDDLNRIDDLAKELAEKHGAMLIRHVSPVGVEYTFLAGSRTGEPHGIASRVYADISTGKYGVYNVLIGSGRIEVSSPPQGNLSTISFSMNRRSMVTPLLQSAAEAAETGDVVFGWKYDTPFEITIMFARPGTDAIDKSTGHEKGPGPILHRALKLEGITMPPVPV